MKIGWRVIYLTVDEYWVRCVGWLRARAFFQIVAAGIGVIALAGVLATLDDYKHDVQNRKKLKHYQAWQVINSAYGKRGSGGRIQALEELNADGISLDRVDLGQAWLDSVNLKGASLQEADLHKCRMRHARLDSADLHGAFMEETDLETAHLEWASLWMAYLNDANLNMAYLTGADFFGASLAGASFQESQMEWASLVGADLTKANFKDANLRGASLSAKHLVGANMNNASLRGAGLMRADLSGIRNWRAIRDIAFANVWGVENPPEGFIPWAVDTMGAVQIEGQDEWWAFRDSVLSVQ